MEDSILLSVKKILGLDPSFTAFDWDLIIHINSVFSTLSQIGIGPSGGFTILDDTSKWEDYAGTLVEDGEIVETNTIVPVDQLNMVKTYVFLRTKLLFDPPSTSFAIDAMKRQIEEHEWRLYIFKETHDEGID